jgi:presenilin-like A22 family membrane protease
MKHPIPLTFALIALFIASQFIGLFIVNEYTRVNATGETKQLPYDIERPVMTPASTILMIISAVLVGTGILLIIAHFRKVGLWKLWYFLSIFLTLTIALTAFIPQTVAGAIAFIAAILKTYKSNIFIQNITELLVYGGLAAIFVPLLNVFAAAILLLLISAYDAYAVWKSKHMVKMAKFQSSSGIFAGISLPYGTIEKPTKEIKAEETTSAIIGGGDMGFPLMFAGAVMLQFGLYKAMIIPVFATTALSVLLMQGKKNHFYPAMPFISIGCFVGYGIMLLLP